MRSGTSTVTRRCTPLQRPGGQRLSPRLAQTPLVVADREELLCVGVRSLVLPQSIANCVAERCVARGVTGHEFCFRLSCRTARSTTNSESCQFRAEFTMLSNSRSTWLREFIVMTWAKIPGAFRCLTHRLATAHPHHMILGGCGCSKACHSNACRTFVGTTRLR